MVLKDLPTRRVVALCFIAVFFIVMVPLSTGYIEMRVIFTLFPPSPAPPDATPILSTADEPLGSEHGAGDHGGHTAGGLIAAFRRRHSRPRPPSPQNAKNPLCNAGDRSHWRPGKCAVDSAWLEPWTRVRPNSSWTLVDVGANKGYVIASWLDVLQHRTVYSPHHLGMLLFNVTMGFSEPMQWLPSHCGGCCECLDGPPPMPKKNKASRIKIYGFEPGVANYKWLTSFFTDQDLVTIRHAAAGAVNARVYFPDHPLGVEIGKVSMSPGPGLVPVDIVTLDEELGHLDWIDVLSTDAEGFDQDVARGARQFLEKGRVGVYQFEMYKPDDYKTIFERLKEWGYDCYFSTASRRDRSRPPKKPFFRVPRLVRITDCWEEEYQGYVGWVNGLCHNTRLPELKAIFTYLANRSHKGGSGSCDGKAWQRRKTRKFIEQYVLPLRRGLKVQERPTGLPHATADAE